MRPPLALALVLACAALPARAVEDAPAAADLRELVDRAFHNLFGFRYVQRLRLELEGRGGRRMTRIVQLSRDSEPVGEARTLVRVLEPPDVRGTSVLILAHSERDDDMFVFLPSYEKVRRVSAAQYGDAFLGTNLTYEDLRPRRIEEWSVALVGREERDGRRLQVVRLEPRQGARTSYRAQVLWLEVDPPLIHRIRFEREGRADKELSFDVADLLVLGDHVVPRRFEMADLGRTELRTRVVVEEIQRQERFGQGFFTVGNLVYGSERTDWSASGTERSTPE